MKNKYNMTKEDNIFFAKRKLTDNLYKSANLEGIAVTFADTVAFVNNVNTGNISINDMLKLKGLKMLGNLFLIPLMKSLQLII